MLNAKFKKCIKIELFGESTQTRPHVWVERPKQSIMFGSFDPNKASCLGRSTQTRHHVWVVRPKQGFMFGSFDPNKASCLGRSTQTKLHVWVVRPKHSLVLGTLNQKLHGPTKHCSLMFGSLDPNGNLK